jgi:uncharacterized protein
MEHPCRTCGACCATLRVSFYWAEADDGHGVVPAERTVALSPFLRAMKGTEKVPPRCESLDGTPGVHTGCSIYDRRPSPCREFAPSWENGERNERCDAARASIGLPPLAPG